MARSIMRRFTQQEISAPHLAHGIVKHFTSEPHCLLNIDIPAYLNEHNVLVQASNQDSVRPLTFMIEGKKARLL